jgi:RNA polymerase sigma factor (sigma-70 family)
MEESALISRLLDGDSEVVEKVRGWIRGAFTPYRARLAGELEDLEQEVLLQLTLNLREGRFHKKSSLATYVRTHVHHKCIDRLRALSRHQWVDVEDLDLPSRGPSPSQELARAEEVDLALRVLEEMPESCRELWQMLQDGMRYSAMSRRLGVAEGTLRARVLRCRRRALELREQLAAAPG